MKVKKQLTLRVALLVALLGMGTLSYAHSPKGNPSSENVAIANLLLDEGFERAIEDLRQDKRKLEYAQEAPVEYFAEYGVKVPNSTKLFIPHNMNNEFIDIEIDICVYIFGRRIFCL